MTHSTDPTRIRGVLSPVVTPFDRELRPDGARLVQHCRWLLEQGVGLAVFGTTSEANSMSVAEKLALLDTLAAAGLSPARMMPGTGCAALDGVGAGATAACCWPCPDRGCSALTTADVIGPIFGRGACSFAPDGRCPVGRRLDDDGRFGVSAGVAGG